MCGLQDVVVFVDERPESAGIVDFAIGLAMAHSAHLTAAFLWPAVLATGPAAFVEGPAIADLIERHTAEVSALERTCRAHFDDVAGRHGMRVEWRSIRHLLPGEIASDTRCADLLLVARPDATTSRHGPADLPETLVLASGRPVLLLPAGTGPVIRRVLIGWNASAEASRAVADAMPFLTSAEAVAVLMVDGEGSGALKGRDAGSDIVVHLGRHGVKADLHRVSSGGERTGRVLLSCAETFGADLIVMGAYGHSRFRELVFGGATRIALREARLPVLMSH